MVALLYNYAGKCLCKHCRQLNYKFEMMKKYIAVFFLALVLAAFSSCQSKNEKVGIEEAGQIAEEAYVFAYPMLEHYKLMFAMAMYPQSGAYTAPFNVLFNNAKLSGPEDTIIVRPNNDTFYSGVWFDLSGQPQVLVVPAITDRRYYSFQIIDLYTHNIDYVGTRKTGFGAGAYMFVGPDWDGKTPEGISKVIRSEGNYLLALGRTQVFGPNDVDNAQRVMSSYKLLSLSAFLGDSTAVTATTPPAFPPYNPQKAADANFIGYFNALMTQGPVHPDEKEMFDRFAKIGIAPGKPFDADKLDAEMTNAINQGIQSAMEKIKEESTQLGERKNGWQLTRDAFGTREAMKGKYLRRAAAAYFGLWGNDLEEAFYPETTFDANNDELDGAKHNYTLHFEASQLPPASAFWSFTMYKLPEQLLVDNAINRYIVSSNTEGLRYNKDGSLDIYIQKTDPGKERRSNWLPANNGKFSLQARIYWPKEEALNPLYAPPAVQKRP